MNHKIILLVLLSISCLTGYAQSTLQIFEQGGKYGLKQNGKKIQPAKYEILYALEDGFFSARLDLKWGFVNDKGEEITPFEYDPMFDGEDYADYHFSEGLASVCKQGLYGYVSKTGELVIPFLYTRAEDFENDQAEVWTGSKNFYINKSGKPIIEKYDFINDFYSNRAVVKLNEKRGYIDRKGNEITPIKYAYARDFSGNLGEESIFTWVSIVGGNEPRYAILDTAGNEITPFKYERVRSFSFGMAMARLGSKWGFVDGKGQTLIPHQYYFGYPFVKGVALMRAMDGRWGFIDTSGKVLTPFKYEETGLDIMLLDLYSHKGYFAMKYNGLWGFVEIKTGKEVTPFIYEKTWIGNGNHYVSKDGKNGTIDLVSGQVQWE